MYLGMNEMHFNCLALMVPRSFWLMAPSFANALSMFLLETGSARRLSTYWESTAQCEVFITRGFHRSWDSIAQIVHKITNELAHVISFKISGWASDARCSLSFTFRYPMWTHYQNRAEKATLLFYTVLQALPWEWRLFALIADKFKCPVVLISHWTISSLSPDDL